MARSRQGSLFDERALPEEEDSGLYAQVVFDRPLRDVYSYRVPKGLSGKILAGKRVLAPFGKGNHRVTGFCVGVNFEPPETSGKLKFIQSVQDEQPLLTGTMLELTQWIADYYHCGWGQVLESVLPRGVKNESGTRWAILLEPVEEAKRPETPLTGKQQRAFETLVELGRPATVKEIGQLVRCGPEVVKALISKAWVTTSRQRVQQHRPEVQAVLWDKIPEPNPAQLAVLRRMEPSIAKGEAKTFLLHGVTGSGKTEVYLRAIEIAIERGREAIVLVPEISLTPQTIERFRQRFDHVAVLHSHLSDVDRRWYWTQIAAGEVQVVVGARSAIFAPCRRLGLIVIDEEHESTFKQENIPRYQTRDVAIRRSELERCPVILGSATPSLESFAAAKDGSYELLSLPSRVANLSMPRVDIVDLRNEYKPGQAISAISRPLYLAMEATVKSGGQVILLLNRRGFSTALLCPLCGHVAKCAHCEISLTFHKQLDRLVCHGCDADFPVPKQCPECQKPAIRFAGFGTERLEQEVRLRFPNFRFARMDSDTMRSAQHYERVLKDFRNGQIDILLGTQMIAKGLDFPNVHLVGVISADTARNLPDFRASERTFQIIAQVAGRTGRGTTPGRVLVQTFNPEDVAVQAAARHDYLDFALRELAVRKEFDYPPYSKLLRVIVRSKTEAVAKSAGKVLAERFRDAKSTHPEVRILGPATAPIPKLKDFHRVHFQIHLPPSYDHRGLLQQVLSKLELPEDAEFAVDVDPSSML